MMVGASLCQKIVFSGVFGGCLLAGWGFHVVLAQEAETPLDRARTLFRAEQYADSFSLIEITIRDPHTALEIRQGAARQLQEFAHRSHQWGLALDTFRSCLPDAAPGDEQLFAILLEGALRGFRETSVGLRDTASFLRENVLPLASPGNRQRLISALEALGSSSAKGTEAGASAALLYGEDTGYHRFLEGLLAGRELKARADAQFERGEFQPSVELYQEFASSYPDNAARPFVLHRIAVAYERMGKLKQAEEAYRRYWRESGAGLANGEVYDGMEQLAKVYLKSERHDDGVLLLYEAGSGFAALQPDRAIRALRQVAAIEAGLQRYEEAANAYRMALNLVLTLPDKKALGAVQPSLEGARLAAFWRELLEAALIDETGPSESQRSFTEALPGSYESCCLYYLTARQLLSRWRPDEAKVYCDKLLASWPDQPDFRELDAGVAEQLNVLERVRKLRELATAENDERRAGYLMEAAKLLQEMQNFDEAVQQLVALAEELPNAKAAAEALYVAANVAEEELGDQEQAQQLRWRLLVLYPDSRYAQRCLEVLPGLTTAERRGVRSR